MPVIVALAFLALVAPHAVQGSAAEVSPISKVLEMLADLEAKIIGEGEAAQKEYAEYAEWCEDKSKDLQYEIKTGKAQVADLKATIAKESSTMEELTAKIEELAAKIATAEADLKAATDIRAKEAAAFAAEESELKEVLSALTRAIGILESKSAASMLQLKGTKNIVQAFSTLVQASVLSTADAGRLTALVQSSDDSEDSDSDIGEPDAAVYEGHSGGIVETLEGLKEKAEDQLSSAQKAETTALHNFEMLKQSLEDEIKAASGEMDAAKSGLAASKEAKAVAEKDLDVTSKDLAADIADLAKTHGLCMTTAEDFEAATTSRGEELAALAAAKKAIAANTSGASSLSYGLNQVSLLQVAAGHSDKAPHAVVRYMLSFAHKQNSKSLAQLASRISSAIRLCARNGQDPFVKVKGLISDLISRLESEGEADASHKAYCDKELSETYEKKADKDAEIEKLSTSIDTMSSRKAVLEEEVATLMKELSDISKSQAGYDKWFSEFESTFESDKADMEQGIEGVKLALKILRDYYAKDKSHVAAEGAGAGIIGLIEVAEADFTKGLAEMESNYATQKAAYESTTKENEITTTAKNQDVKYKTQEITSLTKALAETTTDKSGVQTELDAVMEYLESLHKQCDEVAEPYEVTKARRESEIAGLKEALSILEGEAVLFQKSASRTMLRGVRKHVAA